LFLVSSSLSADQLFSAFRTSLHPVKIEHIPNALAIVLVIRHLLKDLKRTTEALAAADHIPMSQYCICSAQCHPMIISIP
jgi:hypothetical protein